MIVKLCARLARWRWRNSDIQLESLVYDLRESDSWFMRQIAREIERQEGIR